MRRMSRLSNNHFKWDFVQNAKNADIMIYKNTKMLKALQK